MPGVANSAAQPPGLAFSAPVSSASSSAGKLRKALLVFATRAALRYSLLEPAQPRALEEHPAACQSCSSSPRARSPSAADQAARAAAQRRPRTAAPRARSNARVSLAERTSVRILPAPTHSCQPLCRLTTHTPQHPHQNHPPTHTQPPTQSKYPTQEKRAMSFVPPAGLQYNPPRQRYDRCRRRSCSWARARAASCWRATPTGATGDCAGPYCEGWPIYHAVHDPVSGSIYAAAASEWHGAGVWRSADLGETWELSSEGLGYGEDSELQALEGLRADARRTAACSPAARAAGVFESRDGGADLVAAQHARRPARAATTGTIPSNQPPGHLGMPGAARRTRTTPSRFWASSRASASSRRPTTAARGRRATAGCAPTGRSRTPRSATACTSS